MSAPTRAVLVPPRPNLGPDPYPQSAASPTILAAVGFGLVIALLLFILLRRRRKARRRPAAPVSVEPRPRLAEPSSTRDWMIVWSDNVRDVLVERFGPAWRAKTTEEIANDERLCDTLGAEQAAQLLLFLNEADRAKFAADGDASWSVDDEHAAGWRDWVTVFVQPVSSGEATASANGRPR